MTENENLAISHPPTKTLEATNVRNQIQKNTTAILSNPADTKSNG